MRVLLLGPFEVRGGDNHLVDIAGTRLRALIARLAMEPGQVVSVDALTGSIWGDEPPAGGANALQALVSRIRRAVGADRLERRPPGYRLRIEPADVDLVRFERLAQDGRALGDLAMLREAELLWRGPAFADLRELWFAEAAAVRLDRLRLATMQERLAIELADGVDVLDELLPLAEAHPLEERWQVLLVRALYAAGRQADALAVFERTRERLADELGIDPSPELAELHLHILRQEFPVEGATGGRRRSNLRAQRTSFVGRDEDLAALAAALRSARLVSITGPGGAGKTRLAVEAAQRIASGGTDDLAPDGIWMVELAAVADTRDVAPAVLRAIGTREVGLLEQSAPDAGWRLEEFFADQRALLILDNCEHLVAAVAELVDRLLGACPGLRVLATSREVLAVEGEHLYPIPPLRWPERPGGGESVERLAAHPAVRLFCERAAAVRPDFTLGDDNAAAVVEICRRLDGMPLAIELAAARVRAFDVPQIAARLDDRFALLDSGPRTSAPRHRTLRAVIAWSWALLSEPERQLAVWLALCPGGVATESVPDLDALAGLVDKSLVERGGDRYRMLETIRSYALERLQETGRAEAVRREHAHHFVSLAETADTETRRAEQVDALRRLDAEHDNLLAALGFVVEAGAVELGVRLVAAMFWFWHLRGLRSERMHWTRRVLELSGDRDGEAASTALTMILDGLLRFESGEAQAGIGLIGKGIALSRRPGFPADTPGRVLFVIASTFLQGAGEAIPATPAEALSGWERGMTLLLSAADAESGVGTLDRVEEARREFDELGERYGLSAALRVLAEHRSRSGDLAAAAAALDLAAAAIGELGVDGEAAEVWAELAVAHTRRGAVEQAEAAMRQAWVCAEASREVPTVGYVRLAGAELLLRRGRPDQARSELDAAEAEFAGTVLEPRVRLWCAAMRAMMALLAGDATAAQRLLKPAVALWAAAAATPEVAVAAQVYAAVAVETGQAARAAFLLGVAAGLLGTEDRRGYDALLRPAERARAALGVRAFRTAFDRGAALERGAAIELIRAESPPV